MSTNAVVRARIDEGIKEEAAVVLAAAGPSAENGHKATPVYMSQ